ncbi:MAG: gamma-glutamyltransferase [Gammaproteobacteria bacterium]
MSHSYPSETWTIAKPAVENRYGLVASHHYVASQIGAAVLRAGGNAVDAAVAASFAIATQEPWMSGLGGGGQMLIYRASENFTHAVDFGMVAPAALNPADYPLASGKGADLFQWPAVLEDRNIKGYYAMAVPGYVAGMAAALERFGTRGWAEAIAPAIELAQDGLAVDWYATLKIATAARDLSRFPESRDTYLPNGFPPVGEWGGPLPRIKLGRLADTLARLGKAGPRDFYTGDLARAVIADVQAGGGSLTLADLARYQARVLAAGATNYRGATVFYAPGLSAGPTLSQALASLSQRLTPIARPDASAYCAYAESLLESYAERLATLGDSDESSHSSCTTHISVVDREGNLVALTQTLLSVFGSRVMLPATGILMNNGIMWFDPRAGKPNSLAPGKCPLSNMCPTIVQRGDGFHFATGASGGRRIMPAVLQLASFMVDYGMDIDAAFRQPRLDVSGSDLVTLDDKLAPDIADVLASRFQTQRAPHGVYPALFACPNAVGHELQSGMKSGAAFIPSPWAQVAGV